MNRFSRVSAVLAGVIGASGCLSLALVACGTNPQGQGGDGGTTDAPPDRVIKADAPHHDAKADVVSHADAGDVHTTADTGTDAGVDSGVDAGHHDGGHDAGADTSAAAVAFPSQVAAAFCKRMSTCCVGDASTTLDTTACTADGVDTQSIPLTTLGLIISGLPSAGVEFDSAQATTCLDAIAALSCTTNTNTAVNAVATACAAAYTPKLVAGQTGCKSSFDCPSGYYCGPLSAPTSATHYLALPPAGGGTCTLIQSLGSPCVDTAYSTDCNYLGTQVDKAYCGPTDAGTTVCTTPSATDCSNSYYNEECVSGQCLDQVDGAVTCVTSVPFTIIFGNDECSPPANGGYVCAAGWQYTADAATCP